MKWQHVAQQSLKMCALQRGREAKGLCTLPKILSLICSASIYLSEFTLLELNLSADFSPGNSHGSRSEAGGATSTITCTEHPLSVTQCEQTQPGEKPCLPCSSSLSPVPPVLHSWDSPPSKLFCLCQFYKSI